MENTQFSANPEVHKDLACVGILREYIWHLTLCKEQCYVLYVARARLLVEAGRREEARKAMVWGL